MSEGPINHLNCCSSYSCSGHFVNLLRGELLGYSTEVHFWFKSVLRPRSSPGLVQAYVLKYFKLVLFQKCFVETLKHCFVHVR